MSCHSNVTWTNNTRNEIEFDGDAITHDVTWTSQTIPYRIVNPNPNPLTVADGVTLTIEAGVQVRFNEYRSLAADGNLVAVGTANQPIVFTAATGQRRQRLLERHHHRRRQRQR